MIAVGAHPYLHGEIDCKFQVLALCCCNTIPANHNGFCCRNFAGTKNFVCIYYCHRSMTFFEWQLRFPHFYKNNYHCYQIVYINIVIINIFVIFVKVLKTIASCFLG